MTNNKLILALFAVIVFGSCTKEEVKPNESASVTIQPTGTKGGDDDDDPIVQGIVLEDDTTAVNVVTAIIREGTIVPLDVTNANGFSFQVPLGNYYLKVTQASNDPVFTDVFAVSEDIYVTISLD